MTSQPEYPPRPPEACLLHGKPTWSCGELVWPRPERRGYTTCDGCGNRLHERLGEIAKRYALARRLNLSPAVGDGTRGSPGFASTAPANLTFLARTDPRSRSCEPGDIESWPAMLHVWVELIQQERNLTDLPRQVVAEQVGWLDRHVDHITRRGWVSVFNRDLGTLLGQLKSCSGDPSQRIGACPNIIDEGDYTRVCAVPLYAPLHGDTVRCYACGRAWPRREWLLLGDLMEEAS